VFIELGFSLVKKKKCFKDRAGRGLVMKIMLFFMLLISFLFASVDINKANEDELTSLKGIGVKKSKRIIVFREKNGCFKSIDDLAKVKGIGVKTVEKNRENITVSKCE